MSFFLLLNTKEDTLKNVPKQWAPLTSIVWKKNTMEVNGFHQLFGYKRSSKIYYFVSGKKKFGNTLFYMYIIRVNYA